ncbi:MAG TPA: DUF6285 domain-containing protein [Burkholderiales bacterium]|nr:DUF6285 domain-containing protein [Burkholderiales bacterium]
MNDRPDARNLLQTARGALVADLLPALPEALRYTALMIANAMAIAQREIEAGDARLRDEHDRVCSLLGERPRTPAAGALHGVLEDYNRRLARAIRAGRFDGKERAAMLDHLQRTTTEKLGVSNPKLVK